MLFKENFAGLNKKEREDKITNRVLINFGYAMLGYVLLYILWVCLNDVAHPQVMRGVPTFMMYLCGVFVLGAIVCYVFGFMKNKVRLKNYGHMLIGSAVVAFYLNLYKYVSIFRKGAIIEPNTTSFFYKYFMVVKTNYIIIAIALLIYLVLMILYNSYVLYKANSAEKSNRISKKQSMKKK